MKNAAEEADKKEGGGGRVVSSGRTQIGGDFPVEEQSTETPTTAFGDVVVGRPAKPWWSETPPGQVARLEDAAKWVDEQAGSVKGDPVAARPAAPPAVAPVTDESVHDAEIQKHGRIAALLSHELKLDNDAVGRVASRLMLELFGADMAKNPHYTGAT